MEKIIDKLVGLGVAGLVLAVVISVSGFAGAAALTAGLAMLGGPFGMLAGIGVLGIIAMTSAAISKYGIDRIAEGVVRGLRNKGKSNGQIINEIRNFPIISKDMKLRLENYVKNS